MKSIDTISIYKILKANTACFSLKSSKELLLLFKYLVTLCRDITFPLSTKYKANSGSDIIAPYSTQNAGAYTLEIKHKKTPFFATVTGGHRESTSIISMREYCKAIPF